MLDQSILKHHFPTKYVHMFLVMIEKYVTTITKVYFTIDKSFINHSEFSGC